MQKEKEPESPETDGKPRTTDKGFQQRFQEETERWKSEGCPFLLKEGGPEEHRCGAKPHMIRMGAPDEANAEGLIPWYATCANGHKDTFTLWVDPKEMANDEEARRAATAEAGANAGKDPMVATLLLKFDMRTQGFAMEPYIPNPGLGLQMIMLAMKALFDQMAPAETKPIPKRGLFTPATPEPVGIDGKKLFS